MLRFEIVDLIIFSIRKHYEYECASAFLIFVGKYKKYTFKWRVVYTVCDSAVISPLIQ